MVIVKKKSLKGEITVPGDKSIAHRAVMIGALAKGTTTINNFLMSEDCLSTIDCFRKMHVGIEILQDNRLRVQGNGLYSLKQPLAPLNTGRSGTALRLILGLASAQPFNTIITRDEVAQRRPVGKVVRPLRKMGANITGREDGNLCPLAVSPSNLIGITCETIPPEAYIKSPLLIAGLYAEGVTTVVEEIKSHDHTELMLNYFGANVQIDGLRVTSSPVENLYANDVEIPGDFSLAAYFITAGLLVPDADITIKNVGVNPTRIGLLDVYKKMGGKIEIQNLRTVSNEQVADIRVKSSSLKATVIDGDTILKLLDEIPVLVVAATMAKGTTEIKDLRGFKIRESGRLKNVVEELCKMGASITETSDGLVIEGGKLLKGTVVEGNNDAMVAMTLAVAGLVAEGETIVRKAQILDTAFVEFLPELNKL